MSRNIKIPIKINKIAAVFLIRFGGRKRVIMLAKSTPIKVTPIRAKEDAKNTVHIFFDFDAIRIVES